MSAWRWVFGRGGAHAELVREMDAHIAERIADLRDEGLTEAEATMQARREFGNRTLQIERSREVWIAPWLSGVWQDLRYAVRALARQPGFALSAIGILALGIGPVTALFTMFNGQVFRPWPVRDPSSIAIVKPLPGPKQDFGDLSNAEYRYLREHTRTLTHLATWMPGGGGPIVYGKTTASVQSNFVSANYFDMLGVRMQMGRAFRTDEEDYLSPRAVAIISDRLWREYFGAPASILGDTIMVYGQPFTVVGVAEAGFFDVESHIRRDLWMPRPSVAIALASFDDPSAVLKGLADPRRGGVEQVAGRLAPSASRAAALAELDVLGHQFRRSVPMDAHGYMLSDTRPVNSSSHRRALSQQLPAFQMIFGALMLVMLLACANAGNLLLARGLSRRREIAIRLSLGAGRWRVTRQLLTEALLMSMLASGVGLGLGVIGLRFLTLRTGPPLLANPDPYTPDLLVVVFTIAVALLACLASSVVPALRSTRISIAARSAETGAGRPGAGRLRTTLLAIQLALSMVLLVAAGLLTRAVGHALTLDPGFAIHESQAVSLRLPAGASRERSTVFHHTLRDALAVSDLPPLAFSELTAITRSYRIVAYRRDDEDRGRDRGVIARDVSAAYFGVLDIPVVAGRTLANDEGAQEIVVNESAARLFWPEGEAVGRRLRSGTDDPLHVYAVVGVAKDVPVTSLSEIPPVVYRPIQSDGLLLVRDLSPTIVERIAAVARSIEPKVELAARPLADDIQMATREAATASRFAWAVGLLALILATVGAFAVFAYAVEERRREIGVRMALGAQAPQIVWMVISGARIPLLLGLGAGLLMSCGAALLLRRFLYGLSPLDAVTYLSIAAILTAAALLATWVPARRAISINPAVTLRAD